MKKSYFFRLMLLIISMMISNVMPLNADMTRNETPDCHCKKAAIEDSGTVFCGKRYLPMEKIAFIDNLILVEIEDQIFETPALYNDQNGYYIQDVKITKGRGDCGNFRWQCDCGECNSLVFTCCSRCKKHSSGKWYCK